ncbi:hypothetical protein AB0J71_02595 [Nonomuraea sp. NPDC049637]|uniref:hypothetical protein n=1 Tax=Nonomuraea sp. NPDC049637 TaxID=3154356 RepID=UPI003412E4B8
MSKTSSGAGRATGSQLWRVVAIAAAVVLGLCLVAGVLWFFADPLHLPDQVLQVLDQRASVVGMFTGMALGAAALLVAVLALRAQLRAEQSPTAAGQSPAAAGQGAPPGVPDSSERTVAIGGDDSGIVSTGDGARNVQMRAEASGEGRVYQAGGDQTINER